MTAPLQDRLAELLYEAVREHAPVVPYRPWAEAGEGREKSAWRRIADALLASEEWRAREAAVFLLESLLDDTSRSRLMSRLARLDAVRGEETTR